MKRGLRFYPPFLGAGIRVRNISHDMTRFRVSMPLTFYNRNYVGVHFGGSLYAMCDPFYMLILMEHLGEEAIVWDKGATIEFLKPAAGEVFAEFEIRSERIDEIREILKSERKTECHFQAVVVDREGNDVARVTKTIYIRRRGRLPVDYGRPVM